MIFAIAHLRYPLRQNAELTQIDTATVLIFSIVVKEVNKGACHSPLSKTPFLLFEQDWEQYYRDTVAAGTIDLEAEMHRAKKSSLVILLSSSLFAISLTPAHAFRITNPATQSKAAGAVSAFATERNGAGSKDDPILSPAEIRHIEWCARNYRSYDPTNDTYANGDGRSECRSPN
jgi:BA14K-like protein